MNSLFHEIPRADSHRPRDGRYLFGTEDTPFLALKLLQGGELPLYESKDPDGNPSYTHEVGLEQRFVPIEARTVRKFFKRRFFGFRHRLSEHRTHNSLYAYSINGQMIRESRAAGDQKLWDFGRTLNRPFDEESDPTLESIPVQDFYSWLDWNNPPEPSTMLYCPFDGLIKCPVTASVRFSPNTEHSACAHRSNFPVCPHCLGILAERMALKL